MQKRAKRILGLLFAFIMMIGMMNGLYVPQALAAQTNGTQLNANTNVPAFQIKFSLNGSEITNLDGAAGKTVNISAVQSGGDKDFMLISILHNKDGSIASVVSSYTTDNLQSVTATMGIPQNTEGMYMKAAVADQSTFSLLTEPAVIGSPPTVSTLNARSNSMTLRSAAAPIQDFEISLTVNGSKLTKLKGTEGQTILGVAANNGVPKDFVFILSLYDSRGRMILTSTANSSATVQTVQNSMTIPSNAVNVTLKTMIWDVNYVPLAPGVAISYDPPEAELLTGKVSPIVYDDLGKGKTFLKGYDTIVELRKTGELETTFMQTIAAPDTTTGVGTFSFENVPAGEYGLFLSRPGYLLRTMDVTVVKSATTTLKPPNNEEIFSLIPGDINANGVVDDADSQIYMHSMEYENKSGSALFKTDFNGDGTLDESELDTLIDNMGAEFTSYPGALNYTDLAFLQNEPEKFSLAKQGAETVTGKVAPVAYNDIGNGPVFLSDYDTLVELRRTDDMGHVYMQTIAKPDATPGVGTFTFNDVPTGDYALLLYRPGHMMRTQEVHIFEDTMYIKPSANEEIFTLWPGDIDSNGTVENFDSNALFNYIGADKELMAQWGFDIATFDYNANGVVDQSDYDVSIAHYNTSFANYPDAIIDDSIEEVFDYDSGIFILKRLLQTPQNILEIARNSDTISIAWDTVPGATGYDVVYNNTVLVSTDTNSVTISNVSLETSRQIYVRAKDKTTVSDWGKMTIEDDFIVAPQVTGKVSPVVFDDLGKGPVFLSGYDVIVELRRFDNMNEIYMQTIAKSDGTTGIGTFEFNDVPVGKYALLIYRPGYMLRQMEVTITDSTTTLKPPGDEEIFELFGGEYMCDGLVDNYDISMYQYSSNFGDDLEFLGEDIFMLDLDGNGIVDRTDIDHVWESANKRIGDYPGSPQYMGVHLLQLALKQELWLINALQTPQNIRETGRNSDTISIAWNAVPGATGYDVVYNNTVLVSTDTNAVTISNLSQEISELVYVRAKDKTTVSDWGKVTIEDDFIVAPQVTGKVSPVVFDDLCKGPVFLSGYDVLVELRRPDNMEEIYMQTIAKPDGTTGVGTFEFNDVPTGNYQLSIYRPGYMMRQMDVVITENTTILKPPGNEEIFNLIAGEYRCDGAIDNDDSTMLVYLGYDYTDLGDDLFMLDFNGSGVLDEADATALWGNLNKKRYDYPGAPDYLDDYWLARGEEGEFRLVNALQTPQNLREIDRNANSVSLEWDAVPGATGYDVVYKNTILVSTNATEIMLHDLLPNVGYDIYVRAKDKTTVSDWAKLTTSKTTLNAPSGLHAFAETPTTIHLRWNKV